MKQIILIIASMFLLSSCAGLNDSYKDYSTAHVAHKESDDDRIIWQADTISETATGIRTETKLEAALVGIIAMITIGQLESAPFTLTAPTTAYDVGIALVNQTPFFTMGLTAYGIAKKGIQNAGNIVLTADEMHTNDSFNRRNSNIVGDESSISAPFKQTEIKDVE